MNTNVTPLLGPIVALLKSRKFIVALVALLINLLLVAVPELETYRGELMTVTTGLALALIGGITWEDAAKAGKDAAEQPPQTTDALIKQLFGDLVDTVITNTSGQTVVTTKSGATYIVTPQAFSASSQPHR